MPLPMSFAWCSCGFVVFALNHLNAYKCNRRRWRRSSIAENDAQTANKVALNARAQQIDVLYASYGSDNIFWIPRRIYCTFQLRSLHTHSGREGPRGLRCDCCQKGVKICHWICIKCCNVSTCNAAICQIISIQFTTNLKECNQNRVANQKTI